MTSCAFPEQTLGAFRNSARRGFAVVVRSEKYRLACRRISEGEDAASALILDVTLCDLAVVDSHALAHVRTSSERGCGR
jgi:hypothetical protein